MSRLARWATLLTVLVAAMIALLPLRLVGLDEAGVTARAARGTIWRGHLDAARLHGIDLGDVDVRLSPAALLGGGLRIAVTGDTIGGTVHKGRGRIAVDTLTGRLGPVQIGGLPITSIDFEGVSIAFAGDTCAQATGQVRVQPAMPLAGADGLAGTPRCDGAAVVLPLTSASGQQRLDLRVTGDRQYRATLAIDRAGEAERLALLAAGFQPTPQGLALSVEGRL